MHSTQLGNVIKLNSKILVELNKDYEDEAKQSVVSFIESTEEYEPETLLFYSEKDALVLMAEEMKGVTFGNEENPFSPMLSFSVKKDHFNPQSIAHLKQKLTKHPRVIDVYLQDTDFADLDNNLNILSFVSFVLFSVFTILTLLLLYNVLNLYLMKDDKKIRTMLLVGANDKFITKPYLQNALKIGLIAFLGAGFIAGLFAYSIYGLDDYMSDIFNPSYVIIVSVIVFILAMCFPLISTYMIIRLYLRRNYKHY
ncbi:MAG: FtsX-like permease family protein [Saprospiraceae bacterium]